MEKKAIFSLTEKAEEQIRHLLAIRDKKSAGIKIGVSTRGCNGLSYVLEYVDEPEIDTELLEHNGIKIYIQKKAIMYLIGTKMDYIEEDFKTGFVFVNPNAKGHCGCGDSFNV